MNLLLLCKRTRKKVNNAITNTDDMSSFIRAMSGVVPYKTSVANTLSASESLGNHHTPTLQVFLPAIEGHVPQEIIKTLQAFLEFCYIAHCNVQDTKSLVALTDALECFHRY
jgi:hypothetical protein